MEELEKERNREYCKTWRDNNREKLRAYQKAWREKNAEKSKEYQKNWRQLHKDEWNKIVRESRRRKREKNKADNETT